MTSQMCLTEAGGSQLIHFPLKNEVMHRSCPKAESLSHQNVDNHRCDA